MYKEIEGDLIQLFDKGEFELIGHGCNCFNIMEAGIAKSIKKHYPEAYYADLYCNLQGLEKLGNFSITINGVINIYSQYQLGKNLDYEALTLALRKVNDHFKDLSIGLPQIGCGIAGGNWKKVKKIIQKELKDMNVTIVIFNK